MPLEGLFVGITGAQGSGKTTIASLVAEKIGGVHICGDGVSHTILEDKKFVDIFVKKFGSEILGENGNIVRKKLGEVAMKTEDGHNFLSEVCEGELEQKFRKILTENKIVVLDYGPLPLFKKLWKDCHIKVLVECNKETRKQRVLKRDGISEDYFETRDKMADKLPSIRFDLVVENNAPEDFERCVREIAENLKKQCNSINFQF